MGAVPDTTPGLKLGVAILIVLAGFMAYANTFDGRWVWDDASSVLLHKHVQDPAKLLQLFREDQHAFGTGQGNFYRPLLSVTFLLDYLLSFSPEADASPGKAYPDLKPFVFHLSSLFWHLAAALMLLALLLRLRTPVLVWAVVPILYVLHPLHTEAVAYISGRADMMSATFIFAGLFGALSTATFPKRYLAWLGACLCFTAGLLSKESTMIFPLLLALFVFLLPLRNNAEGKGGDDLRILRGVPLLLSVIILGGYIALRATVLRFAEAGATESAALSQRMSESAQAFTLYIQSLFFPTHMHMERTLNGVPNWYALLGTLLIAAFIGAAIVAYQAGQRRISIGLAWFLLAWLPISGIFPLNAPLAEHWMYVPMAGFWWAIFEMAALAAQRWPNMRYATLGVGYALAIAFLALTIARNSDWHSDQSLFEATLKENPNTRRVHFNLAVTYEDLLDNPAGARRHFEETLQIIQWEKENAGQDSRYFTPEELEIHLSLARVNESLGDYSAAARHYALVTAGRDNPMLQDLVTRANYGLGKSLLAMGDINGASRYLQEAATKEPGLMPHVESLLLGAPITKP